MDRGRSVSDDRIIVCGTGLIKWWPVALIGLYVLIIRLGGAPASLVSWLWAPIAVGLVIVLILHRRQIHTSPGLLLFGGYLAYTALSLLWSPDTERGLRFVTLIGVAFLAYVYGRTVGAPTGSSELWRSAVVGLGVALAGLLLLRDPPDFEGLNPDRILGMGVTALVVSAWYGPRGRLYTLGLGALGLGAILFSGSRTATLVMVILLITAPGLRVPRSGRWLLAGSLLVLAVLISLTHGFQERWFESDSGSLWDLATLQDVEMSGRAEVWPVVASSCRDFVLGEGVGAADSFAFEEHSGFPEPHNEYLRVWCDTGLVGSGLFWGVVVLVAVRAVAGMRGAQRTWPHQAALQMAIALLLLSLTDNPLTTAVPSMIPAALAFGWSEWSQRGESGTSAPHCGPNLSSVPRENGP